MACLVELMKFPGWSCAASYFFFTSRTAEQKILRPGFTYCRVPDGMERPRSYDSIRAAGGASSLIRNAGVIEHQGLPESRVVGPMVEANLL
eukprot:1136848-Pelagomonas_calceolata.AAC.1